MRPNRILSVQLRAKGSKNWTTLLLRLIDLERPARSEKALVPPELLFGVKDLPGGFERGLQRWFRTRERLDAAFTLFLGAGYAPFIDTDQVFMAFAQAAEVLHRIAVGGTPLPKAEHRRRVKLATAAIADADLREWAGSVLGASNYLHLSDRLSEVVAGLGELKGPLTNNDPERFVRRVVKTRNYLTHRDLQHDEVLDLVGQHWYGQALGWMVRTWLLDELGLGKKAARRRVAGNLQYRAIVRNLASQ